jgi:hypothetical protein
MLTACWAAAAVECGERGINVEFHPDLHPVADHHVPPRGHMRNETTRDTLKDLNSIAHSDTALYVHQSPDPHGIRHRLGFGFTASGYDEERGTNGTGRRGWTRLLRFRRIRRERRRRRVRRAVTRAVWVGRLMPFVPRSSS